MNTSIGTSRGKPAARIFSREAEPAVDFHGAGVAALHLGQELRRLFLLEEGAAHAALAEIDGERQADRAGADDENLCIQTKSPDASEGRASSLSPRRRARKQAARESIAPGHMRIPGRPRSDRAYPAVYSCDLKVKFRTASGASEILRMPPQVCL